MAVCALQALCGISEPFLRPSCLARIVGRWLLGWSPANVAMQELHKGI